MLCFLGRVGACFLAPSFMGGTFPARFDFGKEKISGCLLFGKASFNCYNLVEGAGFGVSFLLFWF